MWIEAGEDAVDYFPLRGRPLESIGTDKLVDDEIPARRQHGRHLVEEVFQLRDMVQRADRKHQVKAIFHFEVVRVVDVKPEGGLWHAGGEKFLARHRDGARGNVK